MKHSFLACLVVLFASCAEKVPDVVLAPATGEAGEPYLFNDETSTYLSWIEVRDSVNYLQYARLNGGAWSSPITVASGKDWFVNWADYPIMAAHGTNFVAAFLQKSGAGTFAYDVKLTTSRDGSTWTTPVSLNDDGLQAEHGFVSIVPYKDNFFVAWLDGRHTAAAAAGAEGHEGHHGEMSLRAAVIDADGNKLEEWELDHRTCDCCQTGAAITSQGPIVVYRDRSRGEVRDISVTRLVDGAWTSPKTIYDDNWKIDGCPVNGPRIVAQGNEVAIAWYTKAADQSEVKVVFSHDGGNSFTQPVRIDNGNPIGRVDIVFASKGDQTVRVTWVEDNAIRGAVVDGESESVTSRFFVGSTTNQRSSGFPQMVAGSGQPTMAWTDAESKKIRTLINTD